MKPVLTVVIPLWNKIEYIHKTLESVRRFTIPNETEVIIVDDGSTDGTADVAMGYERKYPDMFTYLRIQNNGDGCACRGRNIGTMLANGKYIIYIDADDILTPQYASRAVDYLETHPDCYLYNESWLCSHYTDVTKIHVDDGLWTDELEFMAYKFNVKDNNLTGMLGGQTLTCKCFYRTDAVKMMEPCVGLFTNRYLEDIVFTTKYLCIYKTFHNNADEFGVVVFINDPESATQNLQYEFNYDKTSSTDYLAEYYANIERFLETIGGSMTWNDDHSHFSYNLPPASQILSYQFEYPTSKWNRHADGFLTRKSRV